MENKLQQITEKLYAEGLSKGRADGEAALAAAHEQASKIIAEANAQAAVIIEKAKQQAADLDNGTRAELRLASAQLTSELRSAIERMITMGVASSATAAAWNDGVFVKELIMAAIAAFDPSADEPVKIMVPENALEGIRAEVNRKFEAGVEVVADGRLKTPFRIAPADGSYYISFTENDFGALLQSYIRPEVAKMLFGE